MPDNEQLQNELEEIKRELAGLKEDSRAYRNLSAEKAKIEAELTGSGAIAQGDGAWAVGAGGVGVNGGVGGDVIASGGIKEVHYHGDPGSPQPLPFSEALHLYISHLIATHQHLRLQGIRAGSQPLSVSLEKVYVSLTAVDKQTQTDSRDLTLALALQRYRRLVIIGDPGCGKTTLLAYLTLTYARGLTSDRLQLDESNHLPILLPLRDLGQHLKEKYPNSGKDGPAVLLDFLRAYYLAQNICLPEDFFTPVLASGEAVLLLDGMDEVADTSLRHRIARLIEAFAQRYPDCRFVVTSREVGYDGPARVSAGFGLAKVLDFSPAEVRQFVHDWTRVVETTLAASESAEILSLADAQSARLTEAIDHNPRVAELAVNPLLLTVIALVHRYRAQLPERRSELYEEAVEVLLGHWDEAKGIETDFQLAGRALDGRDRRGLLEPVAFWLHENRKREIELDDLRPILLPAFQNITGSASQASKAIDDFLHVINQRSGLLVERGPGIYGFAHLTFQEYLAARVLAEREDALAYSLKILPDPWWREVLLLEAGYLSNLGKRRVTTLIQAILNVDPGTEPEPHHHLLLAAECLFDVGPACIEGNLLETARARLKKQADAPIKKGDKPSLLSKLSAMNALARIESGKIVSQFWKTPWGEPEWITIPGGEFWMGGDGQYEDELVHKLSLPEYQIARVPVTNAQYALYVQDIKVQPPEHWRGGQVPPGRENHPVVSINWNDALAYCGWLSEKTGKNVTLPSEAEWEKAARGDKDKRAYPWGDNWRELHCNSNELGLGETTPVGLFLNGASPYGCLDMSGNVWEWTRTIWDDKFKYPYKIDDGRENLEARSNRVLRGGAFNNRSDFARCAFRFGYLPSDRYAYVGFRVLVGSVFSRASL